MPEVLRPQTTQTGIHSHALCSHALSKKGTDRVLAESAIEHRPYDVLSYSLVLDWYGPLTTPELTEETRQFDGRTTIRLRIDSADVSAIVLDAFLLDIQEVKIDGQLISPTPVIEDVDKLSIPLATAPEPGSELTLDIAYRHVSPSNVNLGFLAYDETTAFKRQAYTLSAPIYARNWMPCHDAPHDKATAEFRVIVPEGFSVACNGLLQEIREVEGGDGGPARMYHWSDDTPIATYLMVAHASTFHEWSDWYKPADNPEDSIEIRYYVWDEDLDGNNGYNALETFANVPDMMALFASQFGAYPFKKYGMSVAEPFLYGAMENQTMVTLGRNVLEGVESTVAHELLHMWMGDQVTPATWNDIWLNEGAATYGEALWAEASGGREAYIRDLMEKRNFYLASRANRSGRVEPPCYREVNEFQRGDIYNYAVTYSKGAWIYHMLRELVGDKQFFAAMRGFIERESYGAAETEDLIASLEEDISDSPVPIRDFFDQWVYGKGHPIFELEVDVRPGDAGGKKVRVVVRQTQEGEGIAEIFTMPLPLSFLKGSEREDRRFLMTQREQSAEFDLPWFPENVLLDWDNTMLSVKPDNLVISSVAEDAAARQPVLSVWPNPSRTGNFSTIRFDLPRASTISLEVYTTIGRRLAILRQGQYPPGSYSTSWNMEQVPAGSYFIRLSGAGLVPQQATLMVE